MLPRRGFGPLLQSSGPEFGRCKVGVLLEDSVERGFRVKPDALRDGEDGHVLHLGTYEASLYLLDAVHVDEVENSLIQLFVDDLREMLCGYRKSCRELLQGEIAIGINLVGLHCVRQPSKISRRLLGRQLGRFIFLSDRQLFAFERRGVLQGEIRQNVDDHDCTARQDHLRS